MAASLARSLRRGDVLLLISNLGGGKTTFSQGLIQAMGSTEAVLSPTFVLAQTFPGRVPVHHLDFYRATVKDLLQIGVQDYFQGGGEIQRGLLLVEWADRCRDLWPKDRLEVRFRLKKKREERMIVMTAVGARSCAVLRKI